mmetsp:Transcript_45393/g.144887  ORF Transcript_45393/g.144887 Transcript_45393/m.144887 type:complete len:187 (-) Transcript_45393:57-617(-)
MSREDFAGASHESPAVLLARLARDRKRSGASVKIFRHLRDIDPVVDRDDSKKSKFVLLRSARDVTEAAAKLKNCAESYVGRAKDGSCLLVVLKLDGKLVAMGEWCVKNRRWQQIVERCNTRIREGWRMVFANAEQLMPKPFDIGWKPELELFVQCWSPSTMKLLRHILGTQGGDLDVEAIERATVR